MMMTTSKKSRYCHHYSHTKRSNFASFVVESVTPDIWKNLVMTTTMLILGCLLMTMTLTLLCGPLSAVVQAYPSHLLYDPDISTPGGDAGGASPPGVFGGLANSQKILITDSDGYDDDYDSNNDYNDNDAYYGTYDENDHTMDSNNDIGVHQRLRMEKGHRRRRRNSSSSSSSLSSSSTSSGITSSIPSGETYLARTSEHPRISYPNLKDFPNTEIRVRYAYDPDIWSSTSTASSLSSSKSSSSDTTGNNNNNNLVVVVYNDCPRHFLWLSDQAVESEILYRIWHRKYGAANHHHQQHHRDHWSERVLLEKTYFTLFYGGSEGLGSQYMDAVDDFQTDLEGWEVMDRSSNHCDWEGVECNGNNNATGTTTAATGSNNNQGTSQPPSSLFPPHTTGGAGQITSFTINGFSLEGTLPSDVRHLSALEHIDLNGNRIRGTIPSEWGSLTNLKTINMAGNELTGRLPNSFGQLVNLERIWLRSNQLRGTLPDKIFEKWSKTLQVLDLSKNSFRGTIPRNILSKSRKLKLLYLEDNHLSGTLPPEDSTTSSSYVTNTITSGPSASSTTTTTGSDSALEVLDVGNNQLTGTIPPSWTRLAKLRDLNLAGNLLSGSFPSQLLKLTNLEVLVLSRNRLSGKIPRGLDVRSRSAESGGEWNDLTLLKRLFLNDNQFSGTIPGELLLGLSGSLVQIDLGNNLFQGSIPSEIGKMSRLERIDAQGNRLTGTLPAEMNRMYPDIQLNLTNNLITGTVPKIFCGGGVKSSNLLYKQFDCDAILCPAGTFHPNGAASLFAGCRPCPIKRGEGELLVKILGRTTCEGTEFVHGDLNGDGILSEREVLRLLYTYTVGRNWGAQFEGWADPTVNRCDLNGVICVEDSVTKIDLTDAALCSNGDRRAGPSNECRGIPAEISHLSNLEILLLNRRIFLRGTLPTEIGQLRKMKYLDISTCPLMTGTLPTEIGLLTNLRYLNLGLCGFNGTVPEELYQLSNIEKVHLSMNAFTGTLSSSIGKMVRMKEIMVSRTGISGSIPSEMGQLTSIENLEMYGNRLSGVIPNTLGYCTNLKRIDLFNNELTGTIPETLTKIQSLQILHIKMNRLTGTIPSGFGSLPYLSWFDVSTNSLHGTIPESFGPSRTLKDFRLGGNMIYGPVPQSLCSNPNINGGLTRTYGCSGVICPLGTYSDPGHATHSDGCKPCPESLVTMYLGSSKCVRISQADIITILYDVMAASTSSILQKSHWDTNRGDNICSWNGITCDVANETIDAISFPLAGLNQH